MEAEAGEVGSLGRRRSHLARLGSRGRFGQSTASVRALASDRGAKRRRVRERAGEAGEQAGWLRMGSKNRRKGARKEERRPRMREL